LRVFNFSKIQYNNWVPHFSSVINWLLRLGLGKLQRVKPIKQPWIAIIDHSIDVGVKKVLVILRVSLDILSEKKCAIKLQDCECIGLKVAETVNGQSIATELDGIFNVAGVPSAILKDCDRTLNKGVELWKTKHQLNTPIIEDISHIMADAIKKQFENTEYYRKFTQFISYGAKKLRQTPLSFLAPPKLRTKGRFLSIGRLGRWSEKMLEVLQQTQNIYYQKLQESLPEFYLIKPFIIQFAEIANVISNTLKVLKNNGLDETSFNQCNQLLEQLPKNSIVKQRQVIWLKQHIALKKQITDSPLPVSSDIIESLFGCFKLRLERNPQADMNLSVLIIPALCGKLNEIEITQILSSTKHMALKKWEDDNIPYTMAKKRREFFYQVKPKIGGICY